MAGNDLKLVTEFNQTNSSAQYGYQYVDDTTVLERKKIPINVYSSSTAEPWAVWLSVYDFKSCQVLTYVQDAYHTEGPPAPLASVKNFTEVEGKDAILDAFRALEELGGHPTMPPSVLMALEKENQIVQKWEAEQVAKEAEAKAAAPAPRRYPGL